MVRGLIHQQTARARSATQAANHVSKTQPSLGGAHEKGVLAKALGGNSSVQRLWELGNSFCGDL
jgi:hypothetical protein